MKGEFVEIEMPFEIKKPQVAEKLEEAIKIHTHAQNVLRYAITAIDNGKMTVEAVIIR